MNNDKKNSLVERHALGRLHRVEKEKRKPYVKRQQPFNIQHWVMLILFVIILLVMLITL